MSCGGRRRHSLGSWVFSSFQNAYPASERLMISAAPILRQISAFSALETTHKKWRHR